MTVALCPPPPGPLELGGRLDLKPAWPSGWPEGWGLDLEAREDEAEAVITANKCFLSCPELWSCKSLAKVAGHFWPSHLREEEPGAQSGWVTPTVSPAALS